MFDPEEPVDPERVEQNPPALDGLALKAWTLWDRHGVSAFVQETGLMRTLIDTLGLDAVSLDIFVEMMSRIHGYATTGQVDEGE